MAKKAVGESGGAGRVIRRVIAFGGAVGVLWFAVQGGEYSTFALMSQRARREKVERAVGVLQHSVDSLERLKKAIQNDPVVQERIAREEFGMVRGNKELLYRFIESADTARR
jgi:cell division protein FtsB